MTVDLYAEAKRVKDLAMKYESGINLEATFKRGSVMVKVYYFNPRDIPLTIPHRKMERWGPYTLFLYSVKRASEGVS